MFGQRTISANEAWLSGVSELYTKNWLEQGGVVRNNFAQIRTFDSVELRDFSDREVYVSFLPTALFLPYLSAKILGISPDLKFIQIFACLFHFLGMLLAVMLSFLLTKTLSLDKTRIFLYPLFTGSFYIFGFATFKILDFAYYADTAVLIFFLAFLLIEFVPELKKRLWLKAIVILVGLAHEWFFVSITLVSLILELSRKENRAAFNSVIAFHLIPSFIVLALYFCYLDIFDKFEYTFHRTMRRSVLNPFAKSHHAKSFQNLWLAFFIKHNIEFISASVVLLWNFLWSKCFRENKLYQNILCLAFFAPLLHIFLAFEHSAEHIYSSLKLFIPLLIFLPFAINEFSTRFQGLMARVIEVSIFLFLIIANTFFVYSIIRSWHKEHYMYNNIQRVFKNYGYEDIFFSYNLEILMDKYNKVDLLSKVGAIPSWDRKESEPFLHLATRKQVYLIYKPSNILMMLKNRKILNKAKVHLIFRDRVCDKLYDQFEDRFYQDDDLYILDLSKEELLSPDFKKLYSCDERMKVRAFYAF